MRASPRTQESLAVSSDGRSWLVVNASPDLRLQIEAFPGLHPRAPRRSPVAAVLLTSAELDHVLGLFSLRETAALAVYATRSVRDAVMRGDGVSTAVTPKLAWRLLELGVEQPVLDHEDRFGGLFVEARPVPGRVPGYLPPTVRGSAEDVVALRIRDPATSGTIAYCPGAARVDADVRAALDRARCVFFDGTFWSSDEMQSAGVGTRRAEDMAHAPLGGLDGSLARLEGLAASRRVLIHLNNTNPLLRDDGRERAEATARGWDVAYDGMELSA